MKNKEVEKMMENQNQEANYDETNVDNADSQKTSSEESKETPEKPKKKWSKKKIIATVAGGLAVAGAVTVGLVKIFQKPNNSEETPGIDDSTAMENLLEVNSTPLLDAVEKLTETVSNLSSEKESVEG